MSAPAKKSVQDVAVLAASTALSSVFNFGATFILARAFGPALYGRWQAVMTLLWYLTVFDLGINIGVTRDVPVLLGRGDAEGYRKTVGTVFLWNMGLSGVMAAGVLAASFFLGPAHPLKSVLPVLALYVLAAGMAAYSQVLLYAHQGLRLWAFSTLARSVCRLGAILLLRRHGIVTLLLSWAAIEVAVAATIHRLNPNVKPHLAFDGALFRRFLSLGMPSFLLTIVYWQSRIGDRALAALFLGETALGYYGLASTLSGFLITLATQVAQTMQPRILRRYGETGEVASVKEHILEPCRAVAELYPFLAGSACLTAPAFIRHFLPAYVPAVPLLMALTGMSFFLASPQTPGVFLLMLEKQWLNLGVWLAVMAVHLSSSLAFLSAGWGVKGIAAATGLAWLFSFFLQWRVTLPYFLRGAEAFRFIAEILRPFAWAAAVILGAKWAAARLGLGADGSDAFSLVVFFLFYMPVLVRSEKKHRVLGAMAGYVHGWRLRLSGAAS